jgi:hypothetical protein
MNTIQHRDPREVAAWIRQVITIPMLAEDLFPSWEPSTCCLSPFRDEEHPSFGVRADGQVFWDNVTGESGNQFHFYAQAMNLGKKQAFKDLLARAKAITGGDAASFAPIAIQKHQTPKKPQHHPSLETPTVDELTAISKLRSIRVDALQLASDQGFLFTATLKNVRAFILTDQTRKCYLARKMDGTDWEHNGCKAYTLSGSQASWPIGILESALYPAIALTEGVPDALSALHLALAFGVDALVAPVCMSGASVNIPEEALPRFAGKRVRILAHNDQPGQSAADRWTEQLKDIATVDCFSFEGLEQAGGEAVKDLNDLLKVSSESYRRNAKVIDTVMRF